MRWPQRTWLAVLLLAGHLVVPIVTLVIASQAETPKWPDIDWRAESPNARLVDDLFTIHLYYAASLIVVMRGWRLAALVVGILALPVSWLVNVYAYFAVTGVYW